jgi:hypothetical protein
MVFEKNDELMRNAIVVEGDKTLMELMRSTKDRLDTGKPLVICRFDNGNLCRNADGGWPVLITREVFGLKKSESNHWLLIQLVSMYVNKTG